jgi:hypothetical protein
MTGERANMIRNAEEASLKASKKSVYGSKYR